MQTNSTRTKIDIKEDLPATATPNSADIDAPIGMKNAKKQLSQPTNDYIKQNEREARKNAKLSFKEWLKNT